MAIPRITLTDSDSNIYTFPKSFWIKNDPYNTTKNISNLTYAPGGKNIGDGFLEARTISIEGELIQSTKAEMETAARALHQALLKGGQLQISDDQVSRYIEVQAPDVDMEWFIYPYDKPISIAFLAEDPFWHDAALTTFTKVVTGNDTLTVDATGADFIIYPIIEIENTAAVDNPGVAMVQKSDGGMRFQYNDTLFLDGDLLVINSSLGTVKKNNNNAIENFNPGRFLRLQPLSNTIEYEGAAATIRIKYRKVYL
jgi:phage-related protein